MDKENTEAETASQTESETTHFGFQRVNAEEKAGKVAEVFRSVAKRYDIMNDLMSLGIHRLWKQFTLRVSNVRAGQTVLDLAGGTGDLTRGFADLTGATGHVVLADINDAMLREGRDRLIDLGYVNRITYAQADAEKLPFATNTFDCICIAFGLRNVTRIPQALAEMHRCLKPGGHLMVLEFSKPMAPLKPFYDAYSFKVLPFLGKLVTNDADSYRYLAESIRMHPDQDQLKTMLSTAGFDEVNYHNLSGGIVALHRGYKVN